VAVERLRRKCEAASDAAAPSNADNMALVGVLSTGLLHELLVRRPPERRAPGTAGTVIDRVTPAAGRAKERVT
jgi:asparagine synthase (glutamine-hydrolysing)